MPKMKTKRGAAKRLSLTGTGKVKCKKSKLRHILGSKTTKQKRRLRKGAYLSAADEKRIKKILPYA